MRGQRLACTPGWPVVSRCRWAAIGLLGMALSACSSSTAASSQAARPGSPGTQASQAAGKSSASAWDQVTAAGKQEGRVVIMGQGGPGAEALTQGFKRKYPDVQMDYTGASGAEIAAKLLTERGAGRFATDVIVHGTTTIIADLMPVGAVDPIQPFLVGPDSADESKWMGGHYAFADDAGKYDLMMLIGVHIPLVYNPSQISADFSSWKELLDPKYKGKLAMLDPRVAGAGLASATFLYTTPSLGKDFFKQLLGQSVVFTKDDRQLLDWIARGQYAISVSGGDFTAVDLKNRGVPLGLVSAEKLKESSYVSTSFGSVAVLNKAPHPNAAKLYLDWLLSKEGQEDLSKAPSYPSRRTDASTAGINEISIPKPGVSYEENSKETYVKIKDEVIDFVKSTVGS